MIDLRAVLSRADAAARQAYQFNAGSYSYEAMVKIGQAVDAYAEWRKPPKDYELWFTGGEPIR
jgi:hypothetical protein